MESRNIWTLKEPRHGTLMLKKFSKFFKFVVCNLSNSFLVVAILIYFVFFFITTLVSSTLGDYRFGISFNGPRFKRNQKMTFKVVTLILKAILVR